MTRSLRARRLFAAAVLACLTAAAAQPAAAGAVKVGVLKFGTVNWELDVIETHGLDTAEGFDLQVVELAGKDATTVALQAGDVDVIVTDWIWVSRARAEGAAFTFVPYSTAVGGLMVPADSAVRTLADLKGKKLGIAGGPVDKSWLLIRALAERRHGIDLDAATDKVFAAPPLLNEEIRLGRLDAVINFWHFLARLEAQGLRTLVSVEEAARELGFAADAPLLGYVFDEGWADTHQDDVLALVRASRAAKRIMQESDAEWERLRPLTGAEDDATFAALKAGYRRGIPKSWGKAERADAAGLFALLAELGGEALVGKSRELQPGTFWAPVAY